MIIIIVIIIIQVPSLLSSSSSSVLLIPLFEEVLFLINTQWQGSVVMISRSQLNMILSVAEGFVRNEVRKVRLREQKWTPAPEKDSVMYYARNIDEWGYFIICAPFTILEQLERLRSEDTPRRLMITHTIGSQVKKIIDLELKTLQSRHDFQSPGQMTLKI